VSVDDLTGTDVYHVERRSRRLPRRRIGDGATDRVPSVRHHRCRRESSWDGSPRFSPCPALSDVVAIQHQDPTDVLRRGGTRRATTLNLGSPRRRSSRRPVVALVLRRAETANYNARRRQGSETLARRRRGRLGRRQRGQRPRRLLAPATTTFSGNPGDVATRSRAVTAPTTMLFQRCERAREGRLSGTGNRLKFTRTSRHHDGQNRWCRAGPCFTPSAVADLVTVNDLTGTRLSLLRRPRRQPRRATATAHSPRGGRRTNVYDPNQVTGDVTEVTRRASRDDPVLPPEPPTSSDIDTLAARTRSIPADLAAGAIQLFVDDVLCPVSNRKGSRASVLGAARPPSIRQLH